MPVIVLPADIVWPVMVQDQSPKQPDSANGNPGWSALSTLIAGMATWGGIGWLVGWWLGITAIGLCAGMILGVAASTYLIVKKYG